ncbi:MAG TPA: YdbL family protein [Allosphingosinicella sp.]|nr:YdbL family protein [Allosphingosinicella sp.]
MRSRWMIAFAAGFGAAILVGTGGVAYAMLQEDAPARLRATKQVGEQANGYLGAVGSASAAIRAEMDGINIKRRAEYTRLAAERGKTIEEVAATTACDLFRSKVLPGQYYRLPDGVWRQRNGNEPVPLPAYCG